ncbi:MAG: hypothetical protein H3C51_06940 [Rubellimicrobium sp.]|nr:hypothetical protein [Rubellimicrobium sp.]
MSLAFILYCTWVAACIGVEFAPAALRPQLRFVALVAGFVPVILAAFTVALVPALFGLAGIVVLFPAPFAALARMGIERGDALLAGYRARHA